MDLAPSGGIGRMPLASGPGDSMLMLFSHTLLLMTRLGLAPFGSR
jgi:hypothetical protein